jgi:1-acyl-sn-glycerol-3-phosphate acyltransferase
MNGAFRHPLRVGARLIWLAGELMWAAIRFAPCILFRSGSSGLEARASWLQAGCQRGLRIFNVEINAAGPIPNCGLLVSNHLSYLDILVLSALTPSIFVAKRDVKSWPIFGWFARLGGTLFADRDHRTQVGQLTRELRTVLDKGALVVLFPEGTSSDGSTVLPFKSALLEPATNASHPVSASLIQYQLEDGNVREEVCYWKDMTFIPHLLNLLSKRRIKASVCFAGPQPDRTNRKELARHLRSEVLKLGKPGYCPALR